MTKTIVCFGDSNTWGYSPVDGQRMAAEARWPGVLRAELGAGYWVIEEGLSGRTTVWNDPIEGEYKNGKSYLPALLESHAPLDVLVIMLGTNDLKARFSVTAYDIAESAGVLVRIAQSSFAGPTEKAPEVLLIAPPPTVNMANSPFSEMFTGAEEKSRRFGAQFRRVADLLGCTFLDAGQVIVSSQLDGIHFDPAEHAKLGKAVAALVR
jgi:lysophospholipase L1-like esterase